ncbi:Usp domain-containing protein [Citrus sinensis]|uniref:Usp domain-containing protein n=1 Tax=Citrus sinensis TaxID=2711 RepID=A0ACB8K1C2_CITSI|nr:Usp domain-containing protein [Citrus sinensis]
MEKDTIAGSGSAVLQAKEEEVTMIRKNKKKMKVMVAIDESAESFYALKWALDNLYVITDITPEAGSGSNVLTIVHAQQPFIPAGAAFYATSTLVENVKKAEEQSSAALLSRALQVCKENMVNAQTLILDGDARDVICQAVEQMHIDLLVVGSRGLGKVKSVSDYCAHHAVCPILIVKPPKEHHKHKNFKDRVA